MRKKTAFVLIVLCLFFILPSSNTVLAEFENFTAEAFIVGDCISGEIISEKNADKRLAPASITKIMTLLLTFEGLEKNAFALDTPVTVSEKASSMGGSQMYLEVGEQRTVEELIYGIAVESGNDAAVAIAEFIGGTYENFIAMMNNKATELNMTNTHFATPCGLDDENHYSTARDIFLMSRELLKHEDILKYTSTWMTQLNIGKQNNVNRTLVNTNKLIASNDYIDGLKTGFTSKSGYCISLTGKSADTRIISVILNCSDTKVRFNEAKTLLDYALNSFEGKYILKPNQNVGAVSFFNAENDAYPVSVKEDFYIFGAKSELEENKYEFELTPYQNIKIPVEKNTPVGLLKVTDTHGETKSFEVYLTEDVKKCDFKTYLKRIKTVILY